MNELVNAYKTRDDVQFLLIYTREPHSRQPLGPEFNFITISQPKSYEERVEYASTCQKKRNLDIPILVDTMDDNVQKAYGGLPNNVVIVGPDGKVAARKAWNDALFIELELRKLVDDPPQIKHKGAMNSCEECHKEAVAMIAKEHPMTDCSVCHSWFFSKSMLKKPDANANKHAKNPEAPIGTEMSCNVLCHNQEYWPPEHEIAGLPFSHQRHIQRNAQCIHCHGTNNHAFHEMSEKICAQCHTSIGSKKVKPEALKKLK
jgi:Iodothyronine deiodinase